MLILMSDLHLTDGTSGQTVKQGAFELFMARLRETAVSASWRADGSYKPLEQIDLVLLGDILDILRSTEWLQQSRGTPGYVRPWDDPQSAPFTAKIDSITRAILTQNAPAFSLLQSLSGSNSLTLPPAGNDGKPATGAEASGVSVPVRIHYMVGNHDWFLHLPGAAYNAIRSRIVAALGLANNPSLPFPHELSEPAAAPLAAALEAHGVFARHGDIFDPYNFSGNRDQAALGDAVVIDLVTAFSSAVQQELGAMLPPDCAAGLKEIDNVRPMTVLPVWVDGLLRRTCPDAHLRSQVCAIWNQVVDRMLSLPFVAAQHRAFRPLDAERKLAMVLKLSKPLMRSAESRALAWLSVKTGLGSTSYASHALEESAFRQRRARFVVYGHTHYPEMVAMDNSVLHGRPMPQIYLNSGTWRPLHQLGHYRPVREAFVEYHSLTYLAFYKADERGGRSFETWTGSLCIEPVQAI